MNAIFKQQWRTTWLSTLIWAVIMGVLSFLIVLSFPSFEKQGQQLTEALQNISFLKNLKDLTEMSTLDGFVNGQWFVMLPFVLSFYAVLYTNQIFTREMDTRSIEYTLSLPISRTTLILTRFLVYMFHVVLIHAVIFLGLWIGKAIVNKDGSLLAYFEILSNDTLLVIAIGTLVLFISAFFSDYTKSLVINIAITILLYFENMIGKAINLKNQQWNLLNWFKNDQMIHKHYFPISSLLFEIIFSLIFLALSLWVIRAKDV